MTDTGTEQWFAFRAYNSQTLYGWGTEAAADAYADILTGDREINVYGAYPMSAGDIEAAGVEDNSEAVNLGDELAARDDTAN